MVTLSGCGDVVSRQNRYLPTLDGWRAMAVIGVILYHGRSGFFGENSLLYRICAHGILGVDVFFAISGFLICGLLLKEYEDDGDISLRRFYLRRCFRILPPYYVALAIFCAISALGIITLNNADLPSCFLFYRNYLPLGVDERGGLLYGPLLDARDGGALLPSLRPMLLLVAKPRRAGEVAVLLAMLVFCWRTVEGHFQLLAGLLPQANLLTRTDTRMRRTIVGMPRGHLFSQDPAGGWTYWFLPVVVGTPGIALVIELMHAPGLTLWRAIPRPVLLVTTVTQPASWLRRVLIGSQCDGLERCLTVSTSGRSFFCPKLRRSWREEDSARCSGPRGICWRSWWPHV